MKIENKKSAKKLLTVLLILAVMLTTVIIPGSVLAYGPSTLYTPPSGSPSPGALYARAMQASDGSMYATFEQYVSGTPVFPIYKSTNSGSTWSQVGSVSDTQHGYGMRYQPFLYQLPQAIGSLAAGTLLCAGNCIPSDLSTTEIDIYYSTNSGANWTFLSTVATGGKADPSGSYTPVWEPFLMVYNNQLICYYSDERDKSAHNQKIVYQASSNGTSWGSVTNCIALSNSGYRPGMPVLTRMANGNYLMTYEIMNSNSNGSYYQISSNPLSWNVTSAGTQFGYGGSPYCTYLNGTLILSDYGSSNLYTNTKSDASGSWTQISSTIGACYTRCLLPLQNGRLFEISGGAFGGGLNSVTYGDMAISSVYYKIKSVADSKMMDTYNHTATGSAICQYDSSSSNNQQWNIVPQNNGYFKIQSRASGLWLDTMGGTGNGCTLDQYSWSSSTNQDWQIVNYGSYVKIVSRANGLDIDTGALTANGSSLQMWGDGYSTNQQWQIVAP